MACLLSDKDSVWTENPCSLVNAYWYEFFPNCEMSDNRKTNSLTRLVILVFIVLTAIGFSNAVAFLLFAILVILIKYFLSVKRENFDNMSNEIFLNDSAYNSQSKSFRKYNKPVNSANIFEQTNFNSNIYTSKADKQQDFDEFDINADVYTEPKKYTNLTFSDANGYCKSQDNTPQTQVQTQVQQSQTTPNQELPLKNDKPQVDKSFAITPITDLLLANYNNQFVPSKTLLANNAGRYLQEISPGVFTYAETSDTINSNIGISEADDLPPRTEFRLLNGNGTSDRMFYRSNNSVPANRNTKPDSQNNSRTHTFTTSDPRLQQPANYSSNYTKYGAQHETFIDPDSGVTKYAFKQTDNTGYNKPVYMGSSNVNFINFVDPLGRKNEIAQNELSLQNTKDVVEDQFITDSQYFRDDIMERLSRKNNAIAWQQKAFPLSRASNSYM